MVFYFWVSTIVFSLFSILFLGSKLRSGPICFIVMLGFLGATYGLYFQWGSSKHLKQYYAEQTVNQLEKQIELRKLLTQFKKQEFKLRHHLLENPGDVEAGWRLLDVLAIKALQNEEYELACLYWREALTKIPKIKETFDVRDRIMKLIKTVEK